MPTLKLRFPGGRYHATPWGHHVNEGLIEWPPSPWRLLRALIASGFATQRWTEIPQAAENLIRKLATVLPNYHLPESVAAHSRHFMPIGSLAKGREKTTLVFDTWADIAHGEMLVHWPCELTGDETTLLSSLASSLGYVGRSESWVEAEVAADDFVDSAWNAYPHREGMVAQRGYDQVPLMAPVAPELYSAWRHRQVEASLSELPLPEETKKPSKALLKKRREATAPFPETLMSCLLKDTAWWKDHGWSQPPGSQRVLYWRRTDALEVGVPVRPRKPNSRFITTMLLSLTTPSGNQSALPPVSRTLPQGELIHRAMVSRAAKVIHAHCPELTGKDEIGHPLQGHHEHAYTIPLDLDGDGHLDHMIIHATMGLSDAAQRAIRALRRTWAKGGAGDIQVAVAGSGALDLLRQLPAPFDRRVDTLLGPRAGARVWESETPFVFPRFLKQRGKNDMLGQVNAELASRLLPRVERVEWLEDRTRALRHFVRRRMHGGVAPPRDEAYGLRLTFAEPVQGPLILGYAAHYGLGRFRAVKA